jgi:hypothetical protein
MDLYCPICGEPCENDYFHDVAKSTGQTYSEVAADFRVRGCEAIESSHSKASTETDKGFGLTRQEAAGALYDLLGDDMDGAAAMLEYMVF